MTVVHIFSDSDMAQISTLLTVGFLWFFFFLILVCVRIMKHHRLLIACILPFLLPNVVFADKTTQEHLTEGNAFLTSGKLHDAVISYDAAICKL